MLIASHTSYTSSFEVASIESDKNPYMEKWNNTIIIVYSLYVPCEYTYDAYIYICRYRSCNFTSTLINVMGKTKTLSVILDLRS